MDNVDSDFQVRLCLFHHGQNAHLVASGHGPRKATEHEIINSQHKILMTTYIDK